jgi:hypothetical protein
MLIERKPWMQESSCNEEDTTVFFPNRYTEATVAKPFALCDTCLVKADCLYEAMITDSVGIWGGTTEYQRLMLLSKLFNDNSKNINMKAIIKIIENNYYSIPISSRYEQKY